MKISISGEPGSGKSTIAKLISKELNCKIISIGGIQRSMAESLGISTLELNELCMKDSSYDKKLDGYIVEMDKRESGNIIFDSRLAWHFVEDSIKIYFTCDPDIRAKRILARKSKGEKHTELSEVKEYNEKRYSLENERYKGLYGIDCKKLSNYDLIVDTSCITEEQIVYEILEYVNSKLCKDGSTYVIAGFGAYHPTQSIRDLSEGILNDYISGKLPLYPVAVTRDNGSWFIVDGHHRWVGASKRLQGCILGVYEEPHKNTSCCKKDCYDYEDALGYKLVSYIDNVGK